MLLAHVGNVTQANSSQDRVEEDNNISWMHFRFVGGLPRRKSVVRRHFSNVSVHKKLFGVLV